VGPFGDVLRHRARDTWRWMRAHPGVTFALWVVAVLLVGGAAGAFQTSSPADDREAAACAVQWDRSKEEGISGGGADTELRRMFATCPDYPTWQRELERVGGQGEHTLRAGCAIEPSSRVCRDARRRGVID
jgi:hypothetical protein